MMRSDCLGVISSSMTAEKIRAIIAEKQDAALKEMSPEELNKMLEELGAE